MCAQRQPKIAGESHTTWYVAFIRNDTNPNWPSTQTRNTTMFLSLVRILPPSLVTFQIFKFSKKKPQTPEILGFMWNLISFLIFDNEFKTFENIVS